LTDNVFLADASAECHVGQGWAWDVGACSYKVHQAVTEMLSVHWDGLDKVVRMVEEGAEQLQKCRDAA